MKSTSLQILGGQALWALAQALVIFLLAKQSGGVGLIGTFTLGLAVFTPLCLIGGLNLRNLIAIDERNEIDVLTALILRTLVVVFALAVTIIALQIIGNLKEQGLIIIMLLGTRAVDHVSDVAAGFYQNNNQLKRIGHSFFARGCANFLPLAIVWSLSGSLELSVTASFLTTIVAVIFFDLLAVRKMKESSKERKNLGFGALFKVILPSFSASLFPFLDSLHINSLRYAIFFLFSGSVLGLVGIAQTLFAPIQLLVSALGYIYLPKVREVIKKGRRDEIVSFVKTGGIWGAVPTIGFLVLSLILPESLLRIAFGDIDIPGLRQALHAISIAMIFFGVAGYLAQSVLAMKEERYYMLSPLVGLLFFAAVIASIYIFKSKVELIGVGAFFAASFLIRVIYSWMGIRSHLGSQR
ncbi:lipopolysaccharide biosynthesis protein [Variovorax paradoxus]|uniref:lipopolysaccharide biosynthesis protein n=1 Tax=Variovorax paradoxus TaxID=34073 RepID=UPI0029C72184|nr:hypothetical protein [Variovorax paradoxus]WPH22436.1 hypothetical protein RZE78_09785 [Variovorax paradoxus]